VLAEESSAPSLIENFRRRLLVPRRTRLADLLKRGVALGDLREDLDIGTAVHLLIGGFYARYLAASDIPRTGPNARSPFSGPRSRRAHGEPPRRTPAGSRGLVR
jgi:hypothetical protein